MRIDAAQRMRVAGSEQGEAERLLKVELAALTEQIRNAMIEVAQDVRSA